MEKCPYCGKEGKTVKYHIWRMHGDGLNHNPNRDKTAWNKGLNKNDPRVQKYSDAIRESYNNRDASGFCSKEWSKTEAGKKASSKGGGYREKAGRSKKFKVFDSFGKAVTLQSSYENAVFELLSEMSIRWIRPHAIKYNNRNYFADFYLVDFDIFLDPKNDFKAKQDEEKIRLVIEQNNIVLYVVKREQICKSFIASLIQ